MEVATGSYRFKRIHVFSRFAGAGIWTPPTPSSIRSFLHSIHWMHRPNGAHRVL